MFLNGGQENFVSVALKIVKSNAENGVVPEGLRSTTWALGTQNWREGHSLTQSTVNLCAALPSIRRALLRKGIFS